MTIRVQLISEDVKFEDISFPLAQNAVALGRSVRADVQIPHPLISRLHCEWRLANGEVLLRDLNSTNQTILNGEPIQEAVLQTGDRLLLGDAIYVVELAEASTQATAPAAPKQERTSSEMPTTRLTSSVISVIDAE